MNCFISSADDRIEFNSTNFFEDKNLVEFLRNTSDVVINFKLDNSEEKDLVLFFNILISINLNVKWQGYFNGKFITNLEKQTEQAYCWKQDIQLPFKKFLEEIQVLEEKNLFVPHRTKDGYKGFYFNHGWESFCVHGLGYDMTQGPEHYGFTEATAPYGFTKEALEYSPAFVEYFKTMNFKKQYHRIRIMKLKPGGMIGIHNDNPNSNAFATNMAVNNPLGCEMHFFDRQYQYLGIVPWNPGDVYKIQIGLNHYVINRSNQSRYHLIIHGSGGYI